MTVSATYLRQHVYQLLDQVLATGEPLVIERNGRRLQVVPIVERPWRRIDDIPERNDIIVGDPEDLVHLDWSGEWKP